jgi:hypothetical protein
VLQLTGRGELEIRVPEFERAAELVSSSVRQLVYAILGTASGALWYVSRGRSEPWVEWSAAAASAALFLLLLGALRDGARYRGRRRRYRE